ncbi:SRPBCC family protein [Chengkuizengella axinellae]|uniref:SRPBCC family protein n=1 Tax=Chengkuizengella axinellae TaxID=3064388 RepID=A0ABT9IZW2_9BACL|nr:SRPBCC family protein [Chengkuizengella sp. 2205SS18-9]MDP5274916.1 SRPBCC family protein [Chengkuizengella sp. 2205SS18-9]
MAHHVKNIMRVQVPSTKIWEVLRDFSSLERFAPTIESSPLVNDKSSGLGAKRLCTFHNGSNLIEEIIEYQEGQSFKIEISEHSMPLKSQHAEMKVEKVDANTSEISMSVDFVVKGGPFGWLMGFFIMRPLMKWVTKNILTGLAYHSVTGKLISSKMPPKEELTLVIKG